jgi:hypothetical protein
VKTSLNTLEKEEKHYSRFYRNKKNSIVKSWLMFS